MASENIVADLTKRDKLDRTIWSRGDSSDWTYLFWLETLEPDVTWIRFPSHKKSFLLSRLVNGEAPKDFQYFEWSTSHDKIRFFYGLMISWGVEFFVLVLRSSIQDYVDNMKFLCIYLSYALLMPWPPKFKIFEKRYHDIAQKLILSKLL